MKMLVIQDGGEADEILLVAENDAEAAYLETYTTGAIGTSETVVIGAKGGSIDFGKNRRTGIRIHFDPVTEHDDDSAPEGEGQS